MRVLVYAMPSSGASLFTAFLAQVPDSIAVIDMCSLVPPLRSDYPLVVKVTLDCVLRIEDHLDSFQPDLRILCLRDPRDNYQSLEAKEYRDFRGTVLEKLRVLNHVFARRSELFDFVIRYEDLVTDPQRITEVLRKKGLCIPDGAHHFPRGPQQIAQFAMDHSIWCRRNYMNLYGFGNLHMIDWGKLKQIRYRPLPPGVAADIAAACPLVDAFYVPLRTADDPDSMAFTHPPYHGRRNSRNDRSPRRTDVALTPLSRDSNIH